MDRCVQSAAYSKSILPSVGRAYLPSIWSRSNHREAPHASRPHLSQPLLRIVRKAFLLSPLSLVSIAKCWCPASKRRPQVRRASSLPRRKETIPRRSTRDLRVDLVRFSPRLRFLARLPRVGTTSGFPGDTPPRLPTASLDPVRLPGPLLRAPPPFRRPTPRSSRTQRRVRDVEMAANPIPVVASASCRVWSSCTPSVSSPSHRHTLESHPPPDRTRRRSRSTTGLNRNGSRKEGSFVRVGDRSRDRTPWEFLLGGREEARCCTQAWDEGWERTVRGSLLHPSHECDLGYLTCRRQDTDYNLLAAIQVARPWDRSAELCHFGATNLPKGSSSNGKKQIQPNNGCSRSSVAYREPDQKRMSQVVEMDNPRVAMKTTPLLQTTK